MKSLYINYTTALFQVEVKPKGQVIIRIPKYGDVYHYSYINSVVHNIIIGSLWIELYGQCLIKNNNTGDTAHVHFKPAGWFGKDVNFLDGHICDVQEEKKVCIKGDWTQFVCSCPADKWNVLLNTEHTKLARDDDVPPGVDVKWRVSPKPKNSATQFYSMTEFAMGLNELLDTSQTGELAPTDCRYRPDIRCMESGDIDGASSEKMRLEEKQRATRKVMQQNNETWQPRWFQFENRDEIGEQFWTYQGKYFNREFNNCPDIF